MKIREWLFNFFHFNKQERNGVFMLCLVIAILCLVKLLLPVIADDGSNVQLITVQVADEKSKDVLASSKTRMDAAVKLSNNYSQELFVFNPNTITEADAQRLGFSAKLSRTLINFRNKGGKFRKTEDVKKLYGMSETLFQKLEAYILIPQEIRAKDTIKTAIRNFESKEYKSKELVDLNSADSLAIVDIRGIGPAFTKRILKYRKLLGGFHTMEQLKEVYGMNDSLFIMLASQSIIKVQNVTKIPINAIDLNSLRSHPYFSYQTASAIINYRNKHGRLSEGSIRDMGIFDSEKLNKILPYLSF